MSHGATPLVLWPCTCYVILWCHFERDMTLYGSEYQNTNGGVPKLETSSFKSLLLILLAILSVFFMPLDYLHTNQNTTVPRSCRPPFSLFSDQIFRRSDWPSRSVFQKQFRDFRTCPKSSKHLKTVFEKNSVCHVTQRASKTLVFLFLKTVFCVRLTWPLLTHILQMSKVLIHYTLLKTPSDSILGPFFCLQIH